jgi:hypothetical protein
VTFASATQQRALGSARAAMLVAVAAVAIGVAWALAPWMSDPSAPSAAPVAGDQQQPVAGVKSEPDAASQRVDDAQTLSGVVVDRSGHPIAEAKCSAVSLARGEHEEVETGADGAFLFSAPPQGELRLVVEAEGYLVHNEPADRQARGARRIQLKKQPSVRGRVVDAASGAPVPSFVVALLRLDGDEPLPIVVEPPPGSAPFARDDGSFEVFAGAEGPHALCVLTERGTPWRERVELRADDSIAREVRVARGVRLRGRVRDARGEVVVEASVRLHSSDGAQTGAITIADGSFALPALPSGAYQLLVLPQAAPFLQLDAFALDANEPEPFVDLSLPLPASLSGAVTPWTPGSAAEVVVRHAAGPVRRGSVDAATGAIALRDLAPGACMIHVERTEPTWRNRVARALAQDVDPVAVELVAGADSAVQLVDVSDSLARIRGRVEGFRDGDPIVIRAFCESRQLPQSCEGLLRAAPQSDGSFELDGLIPGRWRLQAMRGDNVVRWQLVDIAPKADLEIVLSLR